MRSAVFAQNRNFFGTQLIHLPLMNALRSDHCDEVVAFVPYAGGRVFVDTGVVDRVCRYDREVLRMGRLLRRERFDAVVTLRPQSAWLNLAVGLSGAPIRAGFDGPLARRLFTVTVPRDTRMYRGTTYMRLAESIGGSGDTAPVFRDLAADARPAWDEAGAYCLMPAGGSGSFKRWPLERYVRLAAALTRSEGGARFTWILGPDEAELVDSIASSEVGGYSRVLLAPSVGEIARAALDSPAVVANDCGPAHVAQLLHVPAVILFSDYDGDGPTRVDEWFHPHPRAKAIVGPRGADIGAIEPEAVLAAVRAVTRNPA